MRVEGFFQVTFINIILYIFFFNVVAFYNRKSCSCIYLIETKINVYYLKINTNGKWMVAVITWYL